MPSHHNLEIYHAYIDLTFNRISPNPRSHHQGSASGPPFTPWIGGEGNLVRRFRFVSGFKAKRAWIPRVGTDNGHILRVDLGFETSRTADGRSLTWKPHARLSLASWTLHRCRRTLPFEKPAK